MEQNVVILDEQVIKKNGCFKIVRRYLKGIHPDRGTIFLGLTGWETIEETAIITAMETFTVTENDDENL